MRVGLKMAAILKTVEKPTVGCDNLGKLASNPMFEELRATLINDVQKTANIPVSLMENISDDDTYDSSLNPNMVAVQEANLQSDFQQVLPSGNQKVVELHNFYKKQCAVIENERNEEINKLKEDNMLSAWQYQKQLAKLHLNHDQQRMHLTNRVTASLQLLKISLPTGNDVSSTKTKSRQLNARAVKILNEWYERHINNPYPTDDEKMALADVCGLSLSQVKAWFANKRNRTNNTKPKKQKLQMEKQLWNICTELSGEGPRPSGGLYGNIIKQLSDIVNSSHVFNQYKVSLETGFHPDTSSTSGDELDNFYSD